VCAKESNLVMKTTRRHVRRTRYWPGLSVYAVLVAVGAIPSACLLPEVELVDQLGNGNSGTGGRAGSTGGKSGVTGGWGGRDGTFGGRDGKGGGASTSTGGVATTGPSIGDQCNWDSGRCDDSSCASACPTNDGNYCRDSCQAVIDCVTANPQCQTLSDPVCALRNIGRPNECTSVWENATGDAMNSPGKVALAYITCVCEL
jgi:hypothetical protein